MRRDGSNERLSPRAVRLGAERPLDFGTKVLTHPPPGAFAAAIHSQGCGFHDLAVGEIRNDGAQIPRFIIIAAFLSYFPPRPNTTGVERKPMPMRSMPMSISSKKRA